MIPRNKTEYKGFSFNAELLNRDKVLAVFWIEQEKDVNSCNWADAVVTIGGKPITSAPSIDYRPQRTEEFFSTLLN